MMDIAARMQFKALEGSPDDSTFGIFSHDVIFWFGDLNYRISLPAEEVRTKIRDQDLETLLRYDQLTVERDHGNVFVGYEEAPITFAPTYKYDVGTDVYDSSEKKRTPAWCDRVLWRGDGVMCLHYGRAELTASDHRPVTCYLSVAVKMTVPESKQIVHQAIERELDRMENDFIPDVRVLRNNLHFGSVSYDSPMTQVTTVENVGKTLVQFFFIPKFGVSQYCKPWLTITPRFGMVLPGESVPIRIRMHVDKNCVWPLNTGEEALDEVLILHLENGRDFFIQVSGEWQPCVFGHSLSHLVCMSESVRNYALPLPTDMKTQLSIPKELWQMCDFVYARAHLEEGIFRQSGNDSEMAVIRDALDTWAQFPEHVSVHSVAESILRFLDALHEPVVQTSVYNDVLIHHANPEMARQIIADLDPVHYNVFVYIASFLREVLHKSVDLTIENLAAVFATVLIREPAHAETRATPDISNVRKRALFLMHFLRDEDYSWGGGA
eukprot:c16408_g1_i1.p1 GENE.c16408_g1_i1~~c16408_g1_i1.p1  ORF type:complete len:541 (-),score=152.07 c16408_g1_i1:136-1620(-)